MTTWSSGWALPGTRGRRQLGQQRRVERPSFGVPILQTIQFDCWRRRIAACYIYVKNKTKEGCNTFHSFVDDIILWKSFTLFIQLESQSTASESSLEGGESLEREVLPATNCETILF
jgi:hypothetical protein